MLPQKVWVDGRKEELLPLGGGATNFDYIFHRSLLEVTACLEKCVCVPLDYDGQHLPAVLMLSPLHGPIWMHSGQGQGIGPTKEVIKFSRKAKQRLKEARRLERLGDFDAAQHEWTQAVAVVAHLPPPVSIWLENACDVGNDAFEEVLSHVHDLFKEYLKEQQASGGHMRAKHIAVCLRAVFELHSSEPVTAGVTEGAAKGDFSCCLQELFSWAGVPINFFRPARFAYGLAADDPELCNMKAVLRSEMTNDASK